MVVMGGALTPTRHLHDRLGCLRSSTPAASLRVLRELRRRLTPPRLRDEHLEVFDRHSIQSYKDSLSCHRGSILQRDNRLKRAQRAQWNQPVVVSQRIHQ